MFSKYAITLKQSIHEFEKLHDILESIYGKASKKIERNCFENICTLYDFNDESINSQYVMFAGNSISKSIFNIFSNDKKRCILKTFQEPDTIKNVLVKCNIKKTLGYKLVHELIQDGFIEMDTEESTHKIVKFVSVFESVSIAFNVDEIEVRVKFEEHSFMKSVIPKIIS